MTNVNKNCKRNIRMGLIALDWGTTSLRGYLLAGGGEIIEKVSSADGILAVADGQFEVALSRLINRFRKKSAGYPIIAAGMITSRQGWLETEYVECPAAAADLAAKMQVLETDKLGRIWFVPGVKQYRPEPDIMRGEETQLAGLDATGSVTALLPGTHSKWVELEGGRVMRFTSYMTGDLYGAVRDHTILKAISGKEWSENSFHEGVETGYTGVQNGKGLLNSLFQTRVKTILGISEAADNQSYLSGLLIGTEIGEARRAGYILNQPVTVLGADRLSELYILALKFCSIHGIAAPSEVAATGLFKIAKTAQLI